MVLKKEMRLKMESSEIYSIKKKEKERKKSGFQSSYHKPINICQYDKKNIHKRNFKPERLRTLFYSNQFTNIFISKYICTFKYK